MSDILNSEQQQEALKSYFQGEVNAFLAAHADYKRTRANQEALTAYLQENSLEMTAENLETAFSELTAQGLLEKPEAPTPEPTVMRAGDVDWGRLRREAALEEAQKIAAEKTAKLAEEQRLKEEKENKHVPFGYATGSDMGCSVADQQRARKQQISGVIPRGRQALIDAGEKRAEQIRREALSGRRHL